MNREQTIEAIKVMQAWVDGKACQYNCDAHGWRDFDGDDCPWNLPDARYRIKPEPRTLYFAEFSNGMLSRNPLDEAEISRYGDPRVIRSTKLVKFVEVVEDEAKPIQPPPPPPRTGPLVIGDRVKFIGNLKDVPVGTLATVTATHPADPTVGVEFDGGKRHKGFTVWRTSLERVTDPQWAHEFDVGDSGFTVGGWGYQVMAKDDVSTSDGGKRLIQVLHDHDRGLWWHAIDGKHGRQLGFDLLPPPPKAGL